MGARLSLCGGLATRLLLCAALSGCLPRACKDEAAPARQAEPAAPTVTLRFRPLDKLGHREHWVYDMAVPGTGVSRNALSLDTELVAKVDRDSFAIRQTIVRQLMMQDGKPTPTPGLEGATISQVWGSDHSLVGDIASDGKTPVVATLAKITAQLARFGTLIEYPEQAVAVADSWSIEPQRLMVVPGLEATLRPSYTLQAIEKQGLDREAVIATDIQVDVVPVPVVEGVTVEGGGTASGTLRVRVRDGLLLEARSVMHFSQEITVQGADVLGYREFSATAHVFTTPAGAEPDLAAEPYAVEQPEEDRDCALQIGSALQRARTTPSHQRAYFVSALRGLSLPVVTGGVPIEDAGAGIVTSPDGKRFEVDGEPVELKTLASQLRAALGDEREVVYVYADAMTPLERLRVVLSLLPARAQARLVVRDAQSVTTAPKNARWQDQQLRLSLEAATREERERRLNNLLLSHLMLCEPAALAFHHALGKPEQWAKLEDTILRAYLKCGCTATHLEGLEATLQAIFGSPDLRAIALPKPLDEALPPAMTVGDLAKLLTGPTKTRTRAPAAAAADGEQPGAAAPEVPKQ